MRAGLSGVWLGCRMCRMFSSKPPFSDDPKPWTWEGYAFNGGLVEAGPRRALGPERDGHYGASVFRPRLMQTNAVNPALTELRGNIARQPEHLAGWVKLYRTTLEWDLENVGPGSWRSYTPETLACIDHALRVIRKWEAVYG